MRFPRFFAGLAVSLGLVAVVIVVVSTTTSQSPISLFAIHFSPQLAPPPYVSPVLWRRSAIVMRHCARACDMSPKHMAPGFPHMDDYASHPFPAWPVPKKNCLPLGSEKVLSGAKRLASVVHWPVNVLADGTERDLETAQNVMAGIGLMDPTHFTLDVTHEIFYPQRANICPFASKERLQELKEERDRLCPITDEHLQLRAELQARLGRGRAPPLQTIPDTIENGALNGGSVVAHELSMRNIMQMAGGMNLDWAPMSAATIRRMDAVSARYYCIEDRHDEIVRGMSNLVVHMLKYLEAEPIDGTMIYIGHSSQLNGLAALFNLRWFPHAWAPDSTPPDAMVRFEVAGHADGTQTVSAFFDYSTLGPKTGGNLYSTPAFFEISGLHYMDLEDFKQLGMSKVDMGCVTA